MALTQRISVRDATRNGGGPALQTTSHLVGENHPGGPVKTRNGRPSPHRSRLGASKVLDLSRTGVPPRGGVAHADPRSMRVGERWWNQVRSTIGCAWKNARRIVNLTVVSRVARRAGRSCATTLSRFDRRAGIIRKGSIPSTASWLCRVIGLGQDATRRSSRHPFSRW